jgi:hypothetical protein
MSLLFGDRFNGFSMWQGITVETVGRRERSARALPGIAVLLTFRLIGYPSLVSA